MNKPDARHRPGFSARSEPGLSCLVGGCFLWIIAMAHVDPYIAFRKVLIKDGRVRIMSEELRTSTREVLGGLVYLWVLADDYADAAGVLFGWRPQDIDDEIGIPGFCDALPEDWFKMKGEWAQLPSYQQHNGTTAKMRIADARRKRRGRGCPEKSGQKPDQKRREEKRRDLPPAAPRISVGLDFSRSDYQPQPQPQGEQPQ